MFHIAIWGLEALSGGHTFQTPWRRDMVQSSLMMEVMERAFQAAESADDESNTDALTDEREVWSWY